MNSCPIGKRDEPRRRPGVFRNHRSAGNVGRYQEITNTREHKDNDEESEQLSHFAENP
jgi:hypothetical protein